MDFALSRNRNTCTFLLAAFVFIMVNAGISEAQEVAVVGSPCTASWNSEVQAKLVATGLFTAVDVINLGTTTPTLAQLEQYGAILVYTDCPPLDTIGAGNVIADYVDRGGGVVAANFGLDTGSWGLKGRFNTDNYWAIQPGITGSTGPRTLGTILVTGHPILARVTAFQGGISSFSITIDTLHPSATRIANWSGGSIPLIATREIRGVRRADLNMFPPSKDSRGDLWEPTSDGDRLMANALLWVCNLDPTGPRVAIMADPFNLPYLNDIRAKLLQQRVFSGVDMYNLQTTTPTLAQMRTYDAIFSFNSSSTMMDPIGFGDNLADYVDEGGGVVVGLYYPPGSRLSGRFNTDDYFVMAPSTWASGNGQFLGTVPSPAHPIMAGVRSFNGGQVSLRPGLSALRPDSTLIATWTDTKPLIATRTISGGRRVDLGFLPVSSDAAGLDGYNGDGHRILANSLLYASGKQKPAVLILHATSTLSWFQDVEAKLEYTRRFSHVDIVSALGSTPAYTTIQPYSALLVSSDADFFNPVSLGNELADFVDEGGGVVVSMFGQYSPVHQLTGRWASENYHIMVPHTVLDSDAAGLGAVLHPEHPLMAGVASFEGGTNSYRVAIPGLDPSGSVIAAWDDGKPLAAVRHINNVRRVDLNFFPVSSDSRSDFWDSDTDGDILMANALEWVGRRYWDTFDDGEANEWTFIKGTWPVVTGGLYGIDRKADNFAPFECSSPCTINADINIQTPGARGSLLGWFRDKKTLVEIRLMEDADKVLLIQKSGGVKMAKGKALTPILVGVNYHLSVEYGGGIFRVYLNDQLVMTVPAGTPAAGGLGVRVKSSSISNATILFDRILAY